MKNTKKNMKHEEKKETPAMEAKYHSKAFLEKAAAKASKKNKKK